MNQTMKLTVIPLLEHDGEEFELTDPSPRTFVDLLDARKAVVIKNHYRPLSVDDFGQILMDLKLTYYPYIGGAAPRTIIPVKCSPDIPIVFTANESPPDQPIPFHHELAQVAKPPEYIFFYCDVAAEKGGQTPLIDSTKVYRFIKDHHGGFLQKVEQHGVRYIRTLPPEDDADSPLGRSWKNSWNVATKEELEQKLSHIDGCEYNWHDNGDITITSEAIPAIRMVHDHAQNAVHQGTFCNSLVAAFLGWQDARNDRTKALLFGNNEPMDLDVLQSVADFMKENRVLYSWQHGDVLCVNNKLVMHSREPFVGPRRVLASIWGPPLPDVLQAQPANGVAIGLRPDSYYQPLIPSDPLVFGFWKVPKDICAEVAYQAISRGYRRLDCACDYGNEVEVGQGIQRALKEGIVTRQDLFITSKLWNTYHDPEHVPLAFQKTLTDLGLNYLDEYLIHFPISMEYVPIDQKYPPEWTNLEGKMVLVPNDITSTWRAMEDLVASGEARQIGVCNFSTQLLRQLLSTCRIRPVTLQVEIHPHNSQARLVRFAHDAGMHVTAFSVLGASSYLELDMATQGDVLLENPIIVAIATHYQKSPAQILIRWALQRKTLPLCKTCTPSRMDENRNVFDFYLTYKEMKAIDGLNKSRRYNDPGDFCEPGMGTFCPIYD
jgi:diketogulonate reductase-like aldo/keto reductase